jgi:GNAT superfamily N-acetyltransferase
MLEAIIDQKRADHVLVSGHKSAAMNKDHERCRRVGLGLPQIEDVALVRPVGNVGEVGQPGRFMLVFEAVPVQRQRLVMPPQSKDDERSQSSPAQNPTVHFPVSDVGEIRKLLETDRAWAAYALGDLAPDFFEHCLWFRPPGASGALAMLYRAFTPAVLFAQGDPAAIATILDEFSAEPRIYLHVRPDMLPVLETRYDVIELRRMSRMVLQCDRYRSMSTSDVVRLSSAHESAVKQLFDDGASSGENPDFFHPSMLDAGVFYGLWEAAELVAVAGTHLVVPSEDVAAIGNVYTRRDRRGRGMAARVTGAVVDELLRLSIGTIVLNVNQLNKPAIRVYERLGFTRHCDYYEGLARR